MLNSSIHIRSRSSTAGLLAGAPVTKAWLISLVTAALSVNTFNLHRYLPPLLSLPSPVYFLTALGLIYQLRALERIFGSHKYFSFLLVSLLTTQTMGYICRALLFPVLKSERGNGGNGGLLGGVLLACLVQFWLHVPSHMFFNIHLPWFNNSSGTNGRGAMRVGDKWMVCGWFAYFAYKGRVEVNLVGLAAGFVFEADVGGLRNWRAPRWILWADKNDGSRNQGRSSIGSGIGNGRMDVLRRAMAQQG